MINADLYGLAASAQATYATSPSGSYGELLIGALKGGAAQFSDSQAGQFSQENSVLLQYHDTTAPSGNGTGLSATVFKANDGALTLALRGTLEGSDFVPTDTDIAVHGARYDQITALANWWSRVSAEAGSSVAQYRVRTVNLAELAAAGPQMKSIYALPALGATEVFVIERVADARATGELAAALAQDPRLDVTGHSLGGHLAMAFGALFPQSTASVTTFNAPGFIDNAGNRAFFAQLGGVVPTQASIGAITTNVVADHTGEGNVPWQGIAMLHSRPGQAVDVPIEAQSFLSAEPSTPGALNHSQLVLADALAVYSRFAQLQPGWSMTDFGAALHAAAPREHAGLEGLVSGLRSALGISTEALPTGNDQRETLYQALAAIDQVIEAQDLQGRCDVALLGADCASLARQDFGTFVALKHLGPVALQPHDPGAQAALNTVWQQIHGGLYLEWLSDRNATQYGETDHAYTYSDAWLSDRAALLGAVIQRNESDRSGILPGRQNLHYQDVDSGTDLLVGAGSAQRTHVLFGGEAGDELTGQGFGDRLYGGDGADILIGLGGNDRLEGGAGADTLNGGAGFDWLEGGQGFDRYVFASRDGQDTVVDVDGQGCIVVDGQVLAGGQQLAQGVWCSDDGRWTYRLCEQGDLQISDARAGADGMITVKGWGALAGGASGGGQALGIRLDDGERPAPPVNWVFLGDQHAPIEVGSDGIPRYAWRQVVYLPDGTLQGGVKEEGYSDVLWGHAGNDHIEGLGGNDLLGGYGGDDFIDGGDGDDMIAGGAGADVLLGGGGNDWMFTDAITDWSAPIRADYVWNVADAGAPGATVIASGARWGVYTPLGSSAIIIYGVWPAWSGDDAPGIDHADGGAGDDRLIGGAARDQLLGGTGKDDLMGAGGSDWLFGEAGSDVVFGDGFNVHPKAIQYTAPAAHGNDYLDGGDGDDLMYGQGKADILLGGSGDDRLWGDWTPNEELDGAFHGNDFIDGGAGADHLQGDGGDDTLLSGDGDDELVGDGRASSPYDGRDWLDGGDGNDTLSGGGQDDTLLGGAGDDQLNGDDGCDVLSGGDGGDQLQGGAHDDVLQGDAGDDWLWGEDGNDTLLGGSGNDTLYGGAGNDLLDGGGGLDHLAGGEGDDTYRVSGASQPGHTRISDLAGRNTLELDAPWSQIQVRWVDPAGAERPPADMPLNDVPGMLPGSLVITMGQQTVWVDGALGGAIAMVRAADGELDMEAFLQRCMTAPVNLATDLAGLELLASAYHVDNTGDLPAGAGRTLWGGAGDDTLTSHVAGTVMRGGRGNDRLVMDSAHNTVQMAAGDGRDVLVNQAGWDHTVALQTDLSLDDAQLVLDAQGHLLLDLGHGASIVLAGQPLNRVVDSTVVGALTQGADRLGWAELVARGVRFDGTDRSEAVMGTDAQDRLIGGGGNDLLLGGNGDDLLDGGAGLNQLAGGRGSDTYRVNAVAGETVIQDAEGANILQLGAGLDPEAARVHTDPATGDRLIQWGGEVTVRLGQSSREALTWLEGPDGQRSSFADWVRGRQSAEDQLGSNAGAPTVQLLRGHGADALTQLPTDTQLSLGPGITLGDLVVKRGAENGVPWMDLHYGPGDVLHLQGDAAVGAFSVRLDDGTHIDRSRLLSLTLNESAWVQGTAGNEVLWGLAGADVLAGGGGADVLRGGRGNDTYRMSIGGTDTVEDDDGGPNRVLALGDPQQLRALRLGSDLMVEQRQGDGEPGVVSRLRVRGFFNGDAPWSVTWADGSQQDLRPWVQQALTGQDTETRREAFYQRIVDGRPEVLETRIHHSDGSASTRIDQVVRDVLNTDADEVEATSRYERHDLEDEFLGTAQVTLQHNETTYLTHHFAGSSQWVGTTDLGFFPNGRDSNTWRMAIPAGASLDYRPRGDGVSNVYLVLDPRTETTQVITPVSYSHTASLWNRREGWVQTVTDLRGGDSDNRIAVSYQDPWGQVRSVMVSAGGGNDVVQALAYTGDQPELVGYRLGHFLDGGAGDDRIHGSAFVDEISGGSGRDLLSGAGGNDVYVVEARDDGMDAIYDLDTALMGYLDHPGTAETQPLLDRARAEGLSRQDTVRFGAGIRPEDIRVSWSVAGVGGLPVADESASGAWWGSQRALLLSWSKEGRGLGGVRVAYDAELADAIGFGVERYEFADGTVMTQADMLALAGPDPVKAGVSSVQRDADGTTTVYSTTSHTLSRTRDHVVLLGSTDINATGNERANVLLGNAGNNRLNGKGGADIMAGGLGDDTYRVDDVGDVVAERAGQGTDRIYTTVDYALPENVEELYAASDAGLTLKTGAVGGLLVGRAGNDTLVGARGNDTLKGGAGADTLIGGGGENLLIGGAGADRYLLGGWERNTVRELADRAGDLDVVVLTDTDIRDARFAVDGNDLMLGSYWAQNRIEGAFASRGAARVERFEFKGGDALTWAQVDAIAHQRATVYDFLPPPPEPPLPSPDPATPPWYVPPSYVEEA